MLWDVRRSQVQRERLISVLVEQVAQNEMQNDNENVGVFQEWLLERVDLPIVDYNLPDAGKRGYVELS